MFDVLHLKLLSSLNKQDNIGSKQLLDNMIKLYIGTKNHTKSIELKLLQAYYEHNNKNYTLAIKLNEEALGAILYFIYRSNILLPFIIDLGTTTMTL